MMETAERVRNLVEATPIYRPADSHSVEQDDHLALHPITTAELQQAALTPRTIVPNFLYADVRTRIAAGGVGKTTLALYEAARLALGKPIWGKTPPQSVRTCLVTREDTRGILVARLREVMTAQQFTEHEKRTVLAHLRIIDLSGESFRLSCICGDIVMPHRDNLTALCETLKPWSPDWVIFDPLVSFGVGESRVNDSEQGLIEAFRVLRSELDCCVEGIHHSGKANARDKTTDQYSGRGGSALSDGSRMVAVIQPLEATEWLQQTGTTLDDGENGLLMALPKLSYAPPQQNIFIRRNGFQFSLESVTTATAGQISQANARILLDFLVTGWVRGRRYSKADLDLACTKLGLSRNQVREACSELTVAGKVTYHIIKGKQGSHFEPLTFADPDGDTASRKTELEVC